MIVLSEIRDAYIAEGLPFLDATARTSQDVILMLLSSSSIILSKQRVYIINLYKIYTLLLSMNGLRRINCTARLMALIGLPGKNM